MNTKNNTLLIITAYLSVIIIWSTTPLAIKWSSQGIDFINGLSLRMFIGTSLALILSLFLYKGIPMHTKARQVYIASALAIYGAMMFVYWGAQYIPSGLVSVLFGLSPIFTTLFSVYLIKSERLYLSKVLGSALGLTGLGIIFIDRINLGDQALFGIGATLISVTLHTSSAVWIKHLNEPLPALVVTAGGLLFSLPLFILSYVLFAAPLPEQIPSRTLGAILYLGIMGSIAGFVSYYYILSRLSATSVALATLITPISALLIGKWFNNEVITSSILSGTICVLTGLVMHQFYGPLVKSLQRDKKNLQRNKSLQRDNDLQHKANNSQPDTDGSEKIK